MSQVNDQRLAIHAAIAAVPGMPKLSHYDALRREDAMFVAKQMPAVVVVSYGRVKSDGPLSQRRKNTIRFRWETIVITEDWMTGVGAIAAAAIGGEAISELIHEIRDTKVATIGDDEVYLQLVEDEIVGPPDRAVDAGPAMYVTKWRTTEVLS